MALSRSRTVAAIALLVALALGVGSNVVFAPEAGALASISTLTIVDGPVLVRHGGADFSQAREGDVVAAGDTIRTGTEASVELTYFEGSSLRIDADAEIVVESLRTSDGGVVHTLARGWHVVTQLIGGRSRYETRGPSATASVRG